MSGAWGLADGEIDGMGKHKWAWTGAALAGLGGTAAMAPAGYFVGKKADDKRNKKKDSGGGAMAAADTVGGNADAAEDVGGVADNGVLSEARRKRAGTLEGTGPRTFGGSGTLGE